MKHPRFISKVAGIWFLATPCLQAICDANQNDMSDIWERHYNNGVLFDTAFLPGGDQDGDGQSNLAEATAGTDPLRHDPPEGYFIQSIRHVPAVWYQDPEEEEPVLVSPVAFEIEWHALAGKRYTLHFSTTLDGEWLPVGDPITGIGLPVEISCLPEQGGGGLAEKVFWRVAVEDIDSDSDGLTNHEELFIGTIPGISETFTGIPDAWLALYYQSTAGFNPHEDDDGDGLTNFREFLHGTDPTNIDTDGDGASDHVETNQGSNPDDANDGGNAPTDPLREVEFTVGGDFATWRMEIKALGPRDNRTLRLSSPEPDIPETQSFKLWQNNRYEITMQRTGGYEDWYCWEALVDQQPGTGTFDEGGGWVSEGVRNDQAHYLTVAGHWLVDNRQGLFSSHLHSLGNDVVSGLKAELVPVAIEDNIEATGVDIVSNSVASDVHGYRDKLWIMAPIAGPPPPADYSNEMKFHIPLNPADVLDMECEHATPDPATITLGNGKPTVTWRGSGNNETSDNTPTFRIGAHDEVEELPIGVKTMKHRVVKVAVYPVRCKAGNRPVPMPDKGVLVDWLNQVFAYQLNAWFEVEYKDQTDYDYDPDDDGIAPFWTKLLPMTQGAAYQDGNKDIRIFLIDLVSLRELGPNDEDLNGIALQGSPIAVVNAGLPGVPARPPQQVIETIAHEIGHVLVGEGHPNEGGGRAPLPGTDHSKRLMSTLAVRSAGAKLLVKNEWDEAEAWLKDNPDRREQQQGGN